MLYIFGSANLGQTSANLVSGNQTHLAMIKHLAKSTLRTMGFELRRYRPPTPSRLRAFLRAWSRLNAAPGFIIDIGANHGAWTRSAIDFFPNATFLMVEPQERLKIHSQDLLQRPGVRWLTAGINDQPGSMLLTMPPRDDSASFRMSEADAKARGFPQVEVPVTTLDEIVTRENRIPELVKIDAEGFDLKALRGASKLLGVTEVIFVECGIAARTFENTLKAVCSFMWDRGYRVADFTGLNHSPKHGVLWLSEVAFVKESSPMWAKLDSYE